MSDSAGGIYCFTKTFPPGWTVAYEIDPAFNRNDLLAAMQAKDGIDDPCFDGIYGESIER